MSISIGPIIGYLPFRLNAHEQTFHVTLISGETASIKITDVLNDSIYHDLRVGNMVPIRNTQRPPKVLEFLNDSQGRIVFSQFEMSMNVHDDFLASDTKVVKEKAIEFLNRLIEIYRFVFQEPYITKLNLKSPLLAFTKVHTIPSSNGKRKAFFYAPGGGIILNAWKVDEKKAKTQELLNQKWEVPIEDELYLDSIHAMQRKELRTALFQAQVALETAIDRYLVITAPPEHTYERNNVGFYEFDGQRSDIFAKYGKWLAMVNGKDLSSNHDLWNALDYLKVIRDKIAHTGKVCYERQSDKYYRDRNINPKDTLDPIPESMSQELLNKAKLILDWLAS